MTKSSRIADFKICQKRQYTEKLINNRFLTKINNGNLTFFIKSEHLAQVLTLSSGYIMSSALPRRLLIFRQSDILRLDIMVGRRCIRVWKCVNKKWILEAFMEWSMIKQNVMKNILGPDTCINVQFGLDLQTG